MKVFALSTLLLATLAAAGDHPLPVSSNLGADVEKREAVKRAFIYNYDNYLKYAFGNDTLAPLSKQGQNTNDILGGFGATAYDALSTMTVMDLHTTPRFHHTLEFVKTIDFTKPVVGGGPGVISLFELTIRAIGGLLSAHDLLKARGIDPPKFLVEQAANVADAFLPGYVHDIPFNYVNVTAKQPNDSVHDTANYAEAGTLILEWSRLSELSGNPVYREKALRSEMALMRASTVFPGLPGQQIWPQNGSHPDSRAGRYVTWGGGTDSYFEYLPKEALREGAKANSIFLKTFVDAVESSRKHLIVKTGVTNLTFLSDYVSDNNGSIYRYSHLGCFAGGSWAYGGRLLNRPDIIQAGLELAESCARTYLGTATGLGPNSFGYYDADGKIKGFTKTVGQGQQEFYNEHGYFLLNAAGYHGPEVLESVVYAWRITGQQLWRDIAWEFFKSMSKYFDTKTGWAQFSDVNNVSAEQIDDQGSYLYAEVFKYLYIIFDDPNKVSSDDWVFNTECHPLKIESDRGQFPFVQYDRAKPFPYVPLIPTLRQSHATGSDRAVVAHQNQLLAQGASGRPAPLINSLTQGKQAAAEAMSQLFNMPVDVAMADLREG